MYFIIVFNWFSFLFLHTTHTRSPCHDGLAQALGALALQGRFHQTFRHLTTSFFVVGHLASFHFLVQTTDQFGNFRSGFHQPFRDFFRFRFFRGFGFGVFGFGFLGWLISRNNKDDMSHKDGFLVITLFWVVLSSAGSIPFILYGMTFIDSFFAEQF